MGLLDGNYEDERLNKKVKPAIQGGGYNYLGKEETVTVPKRWLSDPDHVVAELAYITPREAKVLLDLNLYGSLDGKPNNAPGGLPSLQGDMGSVGGGGNSGNSGGGGGNNNSGRPSMADIAGPVSTPSSNNNNNGGDGGRPSMADIAGPVSTPNTAPTPDGSNRPNMAEMTGPSPTVDMSHLGDPDPEVDVPTAQRQDTITDPVKNVVADFKSNPWKYTGLLGISFNVLTQLSKTNQARAMLGLDPIGAGGGGGGDDGDDGFRGDGGESLINQLISRVPYLVGGTTPQDSMVNQYFANQPTSSLSSGLETSYNNAKSNINNILGIATPSQQFGYSQAPYGSYSSTNMAGNPYKDYLTTRGLI